MSIFMSTQNNYADMIEPRSHRAKRWTLDQTLTIHYHPVASNVLKPLLELDTKFSCFLKCFFRDQHMASGVRVCPPISKICCHSSAVLTTRPFCEFQLGVPSFVYD